MKNLSVAILTVSDRSSSGERADRGGPAVAESVAALGWKVRETAIVPDDSQRIRERLCAWSDKTDLILTTGGTGLGPRDVTPEATRAVISREIPGIPERIRREGERTAKMAALSRGVCGVRGRSLILNLPGSPKGAAQALDSVAELLPHAVETLRGEEVGHP